MEGQDKKIGFIGLGAMGRGLSGNLLRKGFDLTVWDMSPDACRKLADNGARVADGPAAMAAAVDVVFTMVPDAPDVRAVALGPGGIAEGGKPGLIHVDMSTVDPVTTREVGAALAERGIRMIDAPVGRGVPEAEAGTVTFMVGGAAEDVAQVEPMLRAMSSEIMHIGPLGSGSAIKLVNNYLASGMVAIIAEAAALGTRAGLTVEQIIGLSDKTGTSNKVLNTVLPSKAFRADYSPGFVSRLAAKDQRLAIGLGKAMNIDLPVGTAVLNILRSCEDTWPNEDFMGSVMRLAEAQAQTRIRLGDSTD